MAAKPSRKQRARSKSKTVKSPKIVAPAVQTAVYKFPSAFTLYRQSLAVLWSRKKLFAGISAVYCALSIVLVNGLGVGVDVAGIRDDFGSRIVGGLAAYSELIGAVGNGSSEAGSVYQLLLFLLVSLALVWALRQVYAGKVITIRDAYYKGMYPFVPAAIILFVMFLQLLPAVVGASVYQLAVAGGAAVSGLESVIWSLGFVSLSVVSLYLLAASIQAFYIVTLPDMTPLPALRSARKLVKGRRWLVLRKIIILPVALLIITAVLTVPIIIVVPSVAQAFLLVVTAILVAVGHSYLYALYRELMHE